MPRRPYKLGDVVWAAVSDRNGVFKPNPRPLLVIKPLPLQPAAPLMCLAVSTDPREVTPDDPCIMMPWDAATGSTTGLYVWCQCVLKWLVQVDAGDVVNRTGNTGLTFYAQVVEQREIALRFKPAK